MRTVISSVLLFCLATSLYASDHCSLIVRVSDPKGTTVTARIAVEEREGTTWREDSQSGSASFCGLGITPVTVSVGGPSCNQVIVRNVLLQWGMTTVLPVIYNREPCLVDAPPIAACVFLFRFVDSEGRAISGATVRVRSPRQEVLKGDEYGRVFTTIAAGQDLQATGLATSFASTDLEIPCTSENLRVERRVKLGAAGR